MNMTMSEVEFMTASEYEYDYERVWISTSEYEYDYE